MDQQNEDRSSRRKFLKGAGLIGAAAVTAPAVAAASVPSQTDLSAEQISKLEEIVKNFIKNGQESEGKPLNLARMSSHSNVSHSNDAARRLRR